MADYGRLKGKLIAVTGATGLLGRELVRQLLPHGATIRLIVRDRKRLSGLYEHLGSIPDFEIVETELTNPIELAEAFTGVYILFNCAAQVSFRFDDKEDIVRVNTDIARHVAEASIKAKVGRLVHVSSIASMCQLSDGGPIDETCYPDNITGWNGYATSKYYSENEIWRGIMQGLDAVIVNPSVILGPGDWNGSGSAALFAVLSHGLPAYTEGGTGVVDVRDVARAMTDLSVTDCASGKRFIVSGANVTYKELISKISGVSGKRPPKIKAGLKTLNLFASLFNTAMRLAGKDTRLTAGLIKTALAETSYSSKALEKTTGFVFTPLDDTISYMASEYRKFQSKK